LEIQTLNSRRWFYLIPARGAAVKLVHALENKILDGLPGRKEVYIGWKEMVQKLESIMQKMSRVAVQYSAKNALPMISRMDAGMFELLKSFRLHLMSSSDLVQQFDACLTKAQINTHLNAANELQILCEKTIRYMKRKLKNHQEINELTVQNYLQNQMQSRGLVSNLPQVIAVGANTADPRYYPNEVSNKPIRNKSLIQLSLRGRDKNTDAIYASASWVIYIGKDVPEKYIGNFEILKTTRDTSFKYIREAIAKNKKIHGWEVDQFARDFMIEQNLDSFYLHRTGHSLGKSFYGNGVNLDNLETRDERKIIPGLCFTIVPGIYFSDYGLRTEINLYIDSKGTQLSTPKKQDAILHIPFE
jgi:Xaa-Pro aminopeptidase